MFAKSQCIFILLFATSLTSKHCGALPPVLYINPFFKDLNLFSYKRSKEVAETNVIPVEAFEGFFEVYNKCTDAKILKRE